MCAYMYVCMCNVYVVVWCVCTCLVVDLLLIDSAAGDLLNFLGSVPCVTFLCGDNTSMSENSHQIWAGTDVSLCVFTCCLSILSLSGVCVCHLFSCGNFNG